MKSAIFTLIILIIICIVINSGALDIISSSAFHYLSLIMLILVFAIAAFFIGFTPKESAPKVPDESVDKENADDQ